MSPAFEAKSLPSGETARQYRGEAWPFSVARSRPVEVSHSVMFSRLPADASDLPSGVKTTYRTQSVWPVKVVNAPPVATSHNRIVLSALPEARVFAIGRERHRPNATGVPLEGLPELTSVHVP